MSSKPSRGAKSDPPEKGESTFSAKDVNENLEAKLGEADPQAAFEEAFADDANAREQIGKIVAELNAFGNGEERVTEQQTETRKKAAAKSKATEAKQEKDATVAAEEEAEAWLKKEVKKGVEQAQAPKSTETPSPAASGPAAPSEQTFKAAQLLSQRVVEEVYASTGGVWGRLRTPIKPEEPGGGAEIPEATKPPKEVLTPAKEKKIPEFYMLLDVGVDATYEEIKKGYRKQALIWHPDKNKGSAEANERFQKISEAFDTLYDPNKREMYDNGQSDLPKKAKKLQGSGWAHLPDEDDGVLTKDGLRMKMKSWTVYRQWNGRIDDDPEDLVFFETDPRYPTERKKIWWRWIGEQAYVAEEEGDRNWLGNFIAMVWKDTPSHWPKGPELKGMNETARAEWKERRMVYNRRKQKVLTAIDLHEAYLALPNREQREKERILKTFPGRMQSLEASWKV